MRIWHISWREIDQNWTSEQLNLMLVRFLEQQERERNESARANAKAKGSVMLTDDEVAGKA